MTTEKFDEHLKRMTESTDDVLGQAAKRLRERHPRYSPIEILEAGGLEGELGHPQPRVTLT